MWERVRARVGWTMMTMLIALIVVSVLPYYSFDPSAFFPEQREVFEARQLALYAHITGATIALAVLPLQLSRWVRRRHLRVHRFTGRLYALGCLIGGTGGVALSTTAHGGPIASAGFAALGLFWLVTTAVAVASVRHGDVIAHRQWMLLSASLVFGAVTLRLYLGAYYGLHALGLDVSFTSAYTAIAWLSWVPNLLVAWWWVRRHPVEAPRERPTKTPTGTASSARQTARVPSRTGLPG
jgi:uncharacterized membrane protein